MDRLLAAAMAMGAETVPGWSPGERELVRGLPPPAPLVGEDPLGEAFCRLRSPRERRPAGATYTPLALVRSMLDRAAGHEPRLVLDPGAGSARFLVEAARRFPQARLLGVEADPVAAVLARGSLAAAGLAERSRVECRDFRTVERPAEGPILFLGNPPYVRHHLIPREWKGWLAREAAALGLEASGLAGLHVHFLLATARLARPGDLGVYVTAAEWLEVNYGRLVRDLLEGPLGGQSVEVLDGKAFPDADTTASVMAFRPGAPAALSFPERPRASLQVGDLFRVHRGQATGANAFWIEGSHTAGLPARFLVPTVTRARDLLQALPELCDPARLRRVVHLPEDLDELEVDRATVERFLQQARARGVPDGYLARHRRAWWALALRPPAPILATYMARRPPAFVLNSAGARHLNIAHGLYPREPMTSDQLRRVVEALNARATTEGGRTYAGGLTKFEPKEMERIPLDYSSLRSPVIR